MKNSPSRDFYDHPAIFRLTLLLFGMTCMLFAKPLDANAQCSLIITNPPAVCEFSFVDLTDKKITSGSTAGLIFTYWKDASATIALSNPATVDMSGTYYLKGSDGANCSVIKPVTVTIQVAPNAMIYYAGSPFCSRPAPVYPFLAGSTGGAFSSVPAGLTINQVTGVIIPSTSKAGKYTVIYTISPSGACGAMTASASVEIEPLKVPTFGWIGPFCLNEPPPVLPLTSQEGVTGTWNPSTISTSKAGTTTYTFTPAEGQCAVSLSIDLTVTLDVGAPVIIVPPDVTLGCKDPTTPDHLGNASATDDCDPFVVLTFTDITSPGGCPGTFKINRTWTATDASGNSASRIQSITVQDITPPHIEDAPADTTVDCNAIPAPAIVTASDECTASPEIQFIEQVISGADCNKTIFRTWTAVDNCGNAASASQVITVIPATGTGNISVQEEFNIYPNPNSGTFRFQCRAAGSGPVILSVLDITGRVILEKLFAGGRDISEEVKMTDGIKGIFLVRVISGDGVVYRKVVVE